MLQISLKYAKIEILIIFEFKFPTNDYRLYPYYSLSMYYVLPNSSLQVWQIDNVKCEIYE